MSVIRVVAVVVAVGFTIAVLRRVGRTGNDPTGFDMAAAPPPRAGHTRPSTLTSYERTVRVACSSHGDVHTRLRPALRSLAAERLGRRGVDLDVDTEQARELLGPELFELVHADRRRPANDREVGLDATLLSDYVDRLEQL